MKNFYKAASLLIMAYCFFACSNNEQTQKTNTTSISVTNPDDVKKIAAIIKLPSDFLINSVKNIDWEKISFVSEKTLPHQLIDEDQNGQPEFILLTTDLEANEKKEVSISFSEKDNGQAFTKKTQAEISHKVGGKWKDRKYEGGTFQNVNMLKTPPQHTDHSYFIRYEGPGWESDKIGYRFYLDWRNAIDIFGKRKPDMVLQDVGQDGFDSYHEPADWGMDVLKVGKSLGIGAVGFWENDQVTRVEKTDSLQCEILQNGILQSKIKTQYIGWQINNKKLDLTSVLTIQAGSHLTRHDISISESLPNLCTGIVRHDSSTLIQKLPDQNSTWGYIATFGKQSLANDNLGMAIFYSVENFSTFNQDDHNHVVVLNPVNNKVSYYFGATWEQETDGIKDLDAFKSYLDDQIEKLNSSVGISYN